MHDIIQTRSNVLHPAAAVSWRDTKLHVLHRDYETRSQAILKTVGTNVYASDASTTVLCCAYAVDEEPVQLWTPGNPVPAEFIEATTNPAWIVCAHGAHFEDAIERHVLHPRSGWRVFPIEKQRCTQAMALAVGLPARLSTVATALELSNRKDAAGYGDVADRADRRSCGIWRGGRCSQGRAFCAPSTENFSGPSTNEGSTLTGDERSKNAIPGVVNCRLRRPSVCHAFRGFVPAAKAPIRRAR